MLRSVRSSHIAYPADPDSGSSHGQEEYSPPLCDEILHFLQWPEILHRLYTSRSILSESVNLPVSPQVSLLLSLVPHKWPEDLLTLAFHCKVDDFYKQILSLCFRFFAKSPGPDISYLRCHKPDTLDGYVPSKKYCHLQMYIQTLVCHKIPKDD